MKRKSLAKKLLTCCTILSGNALAAEINVTGVYTEPRRAGTLSDNYNFNGGSNTLNILLNSNVVLTGMLLNAQNSTLTVANNAAPPKFTISNNASVINIGNIHLISMWNWWGTSSFVVNNTSTTTFTGKWLHIDREPFWGYQDWHVIFASPTIITHSSIGDMLKDDNSSWRWGYIGSKAAPSSLTYATERGHDIGNICFAHQDSEFIIDNSNSTSHTTYYFFSQFLNTFGGGATFNNFGGGVANEIDDIPSIAPVDSAGTLRLVANGSSMTLEGKSLGINNTSRLNLLEVSGSKAVTINLDIYTKNINFNSSGNIVFKSLDMGSKNNITLQQNTNLSLNTQLKSASPTINLGNNLLKISSGTVTLTGDATINTEFTAANSKNGRITVENSTLNLNGLNTLNLNFNANTANENISTNDEQEFEFKVFES